MVKNKQKKTKSNTQQQQKSSWLRFTCWYSHVVTLPRWGSFHVCVILGRNEHWLNHTLIHAHIFTQASVCRGFPLITRTWPVTQSFPRGWHWAPGGRRGGYCLCACREAGPRCLRGHPSQSGQQRCNAPGPRLHGKHPGPVRDKAAVTYVQTASITTKHMCLLVEKQC